MISRVALFNFKCFKDQSIDLSPLSLFAGINGMGKSTVIQALLLLRQNHEMRMLENKRDLILNGELVQIGNSRDALYQYYENREIGVELVTDKGSFAKWKWDAKTDADSLPPLESISAEHEIYKSALFGPDFHYLNAERLGPRVYYEVSNFRVINENQLGTKGEYAANYLSRFQSNKIQIEGLSHPDSNGLTLREQVNAWLGEIRPGTRVSVTSNPAMNLVGLNYEFISGAESGNIFRPTNVGFGLSFLLPLVVGVLSSKPGTLLIVENPEAHLHPRGQAVVSTLLAKAAAGGVQVIVETHSDHVLNGIRIATKQKKISPEQVKLLYFTGDVEEDKFVHKIVTPVMDREGRLDSWPPGFFDQADKDMDRLYEL